MKGYKEIDNDLRYIGTCMVGLRKKLNKII